MFIVTVEHEKDGMWFDEPAGFDTKQEAQRYADELSPPEGHVVVIYACHEITRDDTLST
jgi:hypothetical protein